MNIELLWLTHCGLVMPYGDIDLGQHLTHLPLDKMAAISQMTFSNAFHEWKILCVDSNFTEICS